MTETASSTTSVIKENRHTYTRPTVAHSYA